MNNIKLKNIEFLRLIGCFAIVCFHLFFGELRLLFPDIDIYTSKQFIYNAQKAVDLFFILSGLFFALYLNTNQPLFDFMKKKVIRLYPIAITIVIISFLASLAGIVKFNLYANILILLNISGTPMLSNLVGKTQIGLFWYVSSMLWVLGIYFYLLKNYEKKTCNLIIFLAVFFCYSFLICARNGIIGAYQDTFYYIFNVGFMRAAGGIGIGYFIGEWWKSNSDKIEQKTLKFWQKLLITILECACTYFIFKYLLRKRINIKNDMIFIGDFVVIIMLFLSKKGYISQLLNDTILGDVWMFFSKYTYSVYMVHKMIFAFLTELHWKNYPEFIHVHPIINVIFVLGLVLSAGIFLYHFVEKPCTKYLSKKWL